MSYVYGTCFLVTAHRSERFRWWETVPGQCRSCILTGRVNVAAAFLVTQGAYVPKLYRRIFKVRTPGSGAFFPRKFCHDPSYVTRSAVWILSDSQSVAEESFSFCHLMSFLLSDFLSLMLDSDLENQGPRDPSRAGQTRSISLRGPDVDSIKVCVRLMFTLR